MEKIGEFFKLSLLKNFEELKVVDVKSICFILFSFSSFSIIGTILKSSPTLEQWNQIIYTFFLFCELIANLSKSFLSLY